MVIAPPRKPLSLIRTPQARGSLRQWVGIRCENWIAFFYTIFKKYRPQAAQINRRLWYLHLPDSGSSVIDNSFTSSVTVNRLVLPALVLNKHEYMAGKQHCSTCCFTNLFTKLVTVNHPGLPANAPPASVEPGKKDRAPQSLITDAINPLMLHRTAGPFSRVGSNTSANQFAGLHRRDINQSLKVVNAEKKAPQFVFSNDQQTHERSCYPNVYEKDKAVYQPATDNTKTKFDPVKTGLLTHVQKTYLYQKYMTTRRDIRNINMSCETRVGNLAQSEPFRRISPASSYSVLSHILTHKRQKQNTFKFPESADKIYFRPPTASQEGGLARSSYGETSGNLIHLSKRRPIGSETTSRVHPTKKETKTNTMVETSTAPTFPPISAPNVAGGGEVQVRRLANQVYDLIVERVRRERLLRGH